jgi:hypothetical protein
MTYIERIKEIIATCEVEYNRAKQVFIEKQQRLDLAKSELQRVCDHKNEEERNFTVAGTYYDRSEYITETYCKDCGMFLTRVSKKGGYG